MKTRAAAATAATAALLAARCPDARAQGHPPPAETGRAAMESPDGVPVRFESSDPAMRIYLAHGDVGPFEPGVPYARVGLAPLTLRLPPGTYTIEAESPTSSTGHGRFLVEPETPLRVEVRPGSAAVKTVGSMFIALGVVATVLGVVALVSITPSDQHFNRWAVGLPLTLGGVGVGDHGYGMAALGTTDVRVPIVPPGTPKAISWVPAVSLRF